MPGDSKHTEWLLDTGKTILTEEGIQVKVFEYQHQNDDDILSSWARHFRNHYCLDTEIDDYREGYGCTREEFLKLIKFPDRKKVPGPSIRSGDFGELLVADYLEYLCGYVVPRTRYGDKNIRNESTKGSDIIGFKILSGDEWSENDELAIFEAKAQFSGDKPNPRLQDAVDDSAKDILRKAESLNAIKQRLRQQQDSQNVKIVTRFQNDVDRPHKTCFGAAALFDNAVFDENDIKKTKTASHPYHANLTLVTIKGQDMMKLVHELYERAANEA